MTSFQTQRFRWRLCAPLCYVLPMCLLCRLSTTCWVNGLKNSFVWQSNKSLLSFASIWKTAPYILSVIQCSPVRPKWLCTVHGCHTTRTCWKIPKPKRKRHFFVFISYRFSRVSAQNRDLPFHQWPHETIQFDFTFTDTELNLVVKQVALIYCLYMCFECVAFA